jgi:hypothetical protein
VGIDCLHALEEFLGDMVKLLGVLRVWAGTLEVLD